LEKEKKIRENMFQKSLKVRKFFRTSKILS